MAHPENENNDVERDGSEIEVVRATRQRNRRNRVELANVLQNGDAIVEGERELNLRADGDGQNQSDAAEAGENRGRWDEMSVDGAIVPVANADVDGHEANHQGQQLFDNVVDRHGGYTIAKWHIAVLTELTEYDVIVLVGKDRAPLSEIDRPKCSARFGHVATFTIGGELIQRNSNNCGTVPIRK